MESRNKHVQYKYAMCGMFVLCNDFNDVMSFFSMHQSANLIINVLKHFLEEIKL